MEVVRMAQVKLVLAVEAVMQEIYRFMMWSRFTHPLLHAL